MNLIERPRRLRRTETIRALVRETRLSPDDFVYPLFVCEGEGVRREIVSMPGVFNLSIDELVKEVEAARSVGVRSVILKAGERGAFAFTPDGNAHCHQFPLAEMVDPIGAGDAFGGALCHGLLAGWTLRRTLEAANAAGAIVASRLACADAMPTLAEIETVLARKVSA